jgi:hypothetical protein
MSKVSEAEDAIGKGQTDCGKGNNTANSDTING